MTRIQLEKNCYCFIFGLYYIFYYEISQFLEQRELGPGKMIYFS